MAQNIGARKSSMPKVIGNLPSWNWTPFCCCPVPYPVSYNLSSSDIVSSNVFFNSNEAFMMRSHSNNVTGDEAGSNGGVISGTTSAKAEPIEHSDSVYINHRKAVRCGDLFYMNNKNTTGTLVCSPPPPQGEITDRGRIPNAPTAPSIPSFEEYA